MKFIIKLKICYAILFRCRGERIGQFISNRLIIGENLFYTSDFNLSWKLNNKANWKNKS